MFDCIVVGSGPAGSSAAYHLARRDRSVLLLEKASLPRHKPCSGALSPMVAQWFDFDFEPAIDLKIRQVRYTWKLGDEITATLQTEDPIWVVKRDVFDYFLVEQAIAQGTVLKDQTPAMGIEFQGDTWVVNTPNGDFAGRYLIAADGAEGSLSKWLGFKEPKLQRAAILELPIDSLGDGQDALNFEFGLLKNGCLWCIPQQQGGVIGAATFLGRSPQDYRLLLTQYAAAFGGQYDPDRAYLPGLKLWDGNRQLHTQQAVVIGEAAAITDPLSAEGIRHGMYSGVKAAEAIDQALTEKSDDALAGYTAAMAEWGNNMQWAQRIASVFFRVPGIGYRVGIKRPTMTARMGQLLAGEIQYSDIANRVIKRLSTGFIPGRK